MVYFVFTLLLILIVLFFFKKEFSTFLHLKKSCEILAKPERIWDQAQHNALTDLIWFKDKFFLCFRESDSHAGGQDGKIRILTSQDGKCWDPVSLISLEGRDLRDPMLSVKPDGKLMLTMGGSIYHEGKYIQRHPCVAFSDDGIHWSPVEVLDMPGEWIWRLTWLNGVGYGISYSHSDPHDLDLPWSIKLFKTTDGKTYRFVKELDVPSYPSEATLRFLSDGTMVALLRRRGSGWIGTSPYPYDTWQWYDTGYRIGGPNFLVISDDKMWAASRRVEKKWWGKSRVSVILAKMNCHHFEPILTFPSRGDCSYPGMVWKDDKLYMSYYSSHEGKTSIYFSILENLKF